LRFSPNPDPPKPLGRPVPIINYPSCGARSARLACKTVRGTLTVNQEILAWVEGAIADGRVHWEQGGVVDRPLYPTGLSGKVRFVPTFAYRKVFYDGASPEPGCPFCTVLGRRESRQFTLRLATISQQRFAHQFDASFALCLNNFPYFRSQVTLVARRHRPTFSPEEYALIMDFMRWSKLRAGIMQLAGSGASIPDHAHLAVFDEPLPLFGAARRVLAVNDDVLVYVCTDYPGIAYFISHGTVVDRARQVHRLFATIVSWGLSLNLYFDAAGSVFVIPRTRRRGLSLDRKMGAAPMAGVYLGYAENADTQDIEALKAMIWASCQELTAAQWSQALTETTLHGDPTLLLE
jgi:hypothetical protein